MTFEDKLKFATHINVYAEADPSLMLLQKIAAIDWRDHTLIYMAGPDKYITITFEYIEEGWAKLYWRSWATK